MLGYFNKRVYDKELENIFIEIFSNYINSKNEVDLSKSKVSVGLHSNDVQIHKICFRYDEKTNEDDGVREYLVYIINLIESNEKFILKKASLFEVENYEKFLKTNEFNTPKYYGKNKKKNDTYILLEYIDGIDLKIINKNIANKVARALMKYSNKYWKNNNSFTNEMRMEKYLERINKRYCFAKDIENIGEAYKLFLDRQKTIPITLSHGDFLPMNLLISKGEIVILDWGFGGIMPYSLDIARFIAHSLKEEGWSFKSSKEVNDYFLELCYEALKEKIDKKTFYFDIKLALLNEYVEFIEADEDYDNWYKEEALVLAKDILMTK